MYFYFYDTFLKESTYATELTKVETRLIELGVNGRVERFTIFKNAQELIQDAIKKGAHTVVAVGNDNTFATVVDVAAPHDVSVGYIPMVEDSQFATLLGIPFGEDACAVLSRRLRKRLDVGVVNGHHFVGGLTFDSSVGMRLMCDSQYTVATTSANAAVRILSAGDVVGDMRLGDSTDGRLEVVVTETASGGGLRGRKQQVVSESLFTVEHIDILSDSEETKRTVTIDGALTTSTPCSVTIQPGALQLIVGRDRTVR